MIRTWTGIFPVLSYGYKPSSNAFKKRWQGIYPCRYQSHICIIGSGPAGFYAAQHILKLKPVSKIDIYEKLPVPFGLVRYGVAPDHPDVKNVTHTFNNILKNPNVRFLGNIEAGKDITMKSLKKLYHAVLLCYGSSEDRKLNIPGENEHVISARQFVGWYNGLPENKDLHINLEGKARAIIIGHGNVALDVARILLTAPHLLEGTDISPYALDALKKSTLREVVVCGRRGPLQVAFTIKEFRELLNLEGVNTNFDLEDFHGISENLLNSLSRPRKRLTELLLKSAHESVSKPFQHDDRYLNVQFYRSPVKIIAYGNNRLMLTLACNDINPKNPELVVTSDRTEEEVCDIVFRSIGYKGRRIFSDVPFDEKNGIIPNKNGRVDKGLYCSGWLAQGPRGVILSTMQNAFEVAKVIAEDLNGLSEVGKLGYYGLEEHLNPDTKVTTYKDYLKIADYESKNNRKVTSIEEMLAIVNKNDSSEGSKTQ